MFYLNHKTLVAVTEQIIYDATVWEAYHKQYQAVSNSKFIII